MSADELKLDRRRLFVLGASSVLPACSAGGSGTDIGVGVGGAGGGSSGSTSSDTTSTSSSTGTACAGGGSSERLDFAKYPQLMQSGGSVRFQGNGYSDPSCGQPDILVIAHGGGSYTALSASCSHACCNPSFNGTQIKCPCHGALWDATTGVWAGGHTAKALAVLEVCVDATGLTVSW
jgi:nitrite reductase/ring-hydroxylating ferredoxin subunit